MKSIPPVAADGQSLDYSPVSAASVSDQKPLIIEWGV